MLNGEFKITGGTGCGHVKTGCETGACEKVKEAIVTDQRDYVFMETEEGIAYNLHRNSLEDKAVYYTKGSLEAKLQYLFRRFVREGDYVLDIGANSGFHTVCLSGIVGDAGRVHAFEPVPFNYIKMVTNLHLNGIRNVVTHDCALGATNRQQVMNVIREGELEQGNHSLAANEKIVGALKDKIDPLEVSVRRLDDVLPSIPRLDFIKIDVEGYENEVLKGAQALIRKHQPIVIMEWVEPRLKHLGIERGQFPPLFGDNYAFFEINCDDADDPSRVTALSPYRFDRHMSAGSWDLVCLPLRRFRSDQDG